MTILPIHEEQEELKSKFDKKNVGLLAVGATVLAGVALYFITGISQFYYSVSKELPVITTKLAYLQTELTELKSFKSKGKRFTRNDGELLRREILTYTNAAFDLRKKDCNDLATRIKLMEQRGQYHLKSHLKDEHQREGGK